MANEPSIPWISTAHSISKTKLSIDLKFNFRA
jgi:hypothetical protein